MHELSICQAIAGTALHYADGYHVSRIEVQVGYFRQVVPDSLQFYWPVLTKDTPLEGSELEIEEVPAVIECRSCGQLTTLEWPVMVCSGCGGNDVFLRSGEELLIAGVTRTKEHG
jgi:hydrogenase nickel incorporation protein HypA/HybF